MAVELFVRLLMVHPRRRSLCNAVSCAPVGQNESWKLPLLLQHVREQVLVVAGVFSIQAIVGTHHASGTSIANADFKREQIGFAHGSLINVHVDGIAAALLIVQGVMFDVADHVLVLRALDQSADEFSGKNWVFTEIFKVAAVSRFTRDVNSAT